MNDRATTYATTLVVVIHLLINIVHGVAHQELHVGLSAPGAVFVVAVVLILPLIGMVLVWAAKERLGLILLSASMFASLLFGLYHHFLVSSPDHVHSQPASTWGIAFVYSAYALLITEAIGTYVGVHFLWIAKRVAASPAQGR